jgi:hypothetical protein
MRRKGCSQQQLAEHLQYPIEWIRIKLASFTPFEMEDLARMCRFLEYPLTDLLYEAALDSPNRKES